MQNFAVSVSSEYVNQEFDRKAYEYDRNLLNQKRIEAASELNRKREEFLDDMSPSILSILLRIFE